VGGGVFVFDVFSNPAFTIENSILAGNTDNGGTPNDLVPDLDSVLTINHSLIGVADNIVQTITGDVGNQTGTAANPFDPLLGPLANNGGPTLTHALLPGSPALDAGDPSIVFNPAEFDQRGAPFTRVFGSRIDIGSVEDQPIPDSADFDNDNDIDGADFLAWQRGFGTTTGAAKTDGDADNDGDVDAADLGAWESQFGGPAPLVAAVDSGQSAVGSEPVALATQSVVVSPIVASQIVLPSLALVQSSSEPVFASTAIVAPIAPSPALARGELVDLALAFALQDQVDFVQQAKTSLATPVLNREADIAFIRRDDDVTRPASKSETSATTTRPDDDSSDAAKRRDAWEDAFDEVFAGEVFAKELETV